MNAHSEAHPQQNSCAAINWTCPYTPSIYICGTYTPALPPCLCFTNGSTILIQLFCMSWWGHKTETGRWWSIVVG